MDVEDGAQAAMVEASEEADVAADVAVDLGIRWDTIQVKHTIEYIR